MYYDRQGNSINLEKWSSLFHDKSYQKLASTELQNGCTVSTVWLGMEHGNDGTGPLIFETMVFSSDGNEQEVYRYATEEKALKHHTYLCRDEATYIGEENPTRWQRIGWELKDEEDQ